MKQEICLRQQASCTDCELIYTTSKGSNRTDVPSKKAVPSLKIIEKRKQLVAFTFQSWKMHNRKSWWWWWVGPANRTIFDYEVCFFELKLVEKCRWRLFFLEIWHTWEECFRNLHLLARLQVIIVCWKNLAQVFSKILACCRVRSPILKQ